MSELEKGSSEAPFADGSYTLLVCPRCRGLLRFADCSSEGMFDRAECCSSQWFYPTDANWTAGGGRPESAALVIRAVEVAT